MNMAERIGYANNPRGDLYEKLSVLYECFGGDLTLNQMRVALFVHLEADAGRKPSHGQVSRETKISPSTVSRCVIALVNLGLLKEKVDPDDRRRHLLSVTNALQECCDMAYRRFETFGSLTL